MKNILILLLIFLIACKNKESKVSTQEIDYQAYADSLKQAYKKHYAPVYTPPNDSIAKIRKPPYEYVSYIGLSEFCYDKSIVKLHRKLFPNDQKDERLEDAFPGYRSIEKASNNLIQNMTIKERLVYALVYPERYYQTCSGFIHEEQRVFRKKNIVFQHQRSPEGFHMSERQLLALEQHKDSVAYYIKKCYKNKKTIPIGIVELVRELQLFQLTPLLLNFTKNEEDHISYTLCINMMYDDQYPPFFKSKVLKEAISKSRYYQKEPIIWNLLPLEKNNQRISELESLIQSYYEWKMVTHSNTL